MEKFSYKQKLDIFFRFLLPYIAIILIMLCVGSYIYNQSIVMFRNNSIQNEITHLKKGSDVIDARFEEIINMVIQINSEGPLSELGNKNGSLQSKDFLLLYDLQKQIQKYAMTNKFITDLFVYLKNIDTVVSFNYIYPKVKDDFYGTIFYYNGLSYSAWVNKLFENDYANIWATEDVYFNDMRGSRPMITYSQNLSYSQYDRKGEVISILISKDTFKNNLGFVDDLDGVGYFILDEKGNTLLNEKADLSIVDEFRNMPQQNEGYVQLKSNDSKNILVYLKYPLMGWTFVKVLPEAYIIEKANYFKSFYITITAFAFLIGALIAIFLAYNNSKPLYSILGILYSSNFTKEKRTFGNTHKYIRNTLQELVSKNKLLQQKVSEQEPILKENTLRKVLLGGFNSREEINDALAAVGVENSGEVYFVSLIVINGYQKTQIKKDINELSLSRLVISDFIHEHFNENLYLLFLDAEIIAVIHSFKKQKEYDFIKFLDDKYLAISNELQNIYGVRIFVGIGEEINELINLPVSYHQAEKALENVSLIDGERILNYKDIMQETESYYYPIEIESRLISMVKAGEIKEATYTLDMIYGENFNKRSIQGNTLNQLINELLGTLLKIKDDIVKGDMEQKAAFFNIINEVNSANTVENRFKCVMKGFDYLCTLVNGRKKSHNDDLKEKMISYIKQHYNDSELCLAGVAKHFKLSEKYVSDFFKEQTGSNFVSYVESIRMENAVDFLLKSDIPIAEISGMIGYYNNNTFYKAFRRKFGVSPTTYKQQCR